jgi:hypothetical protein
VTGKRLSDSQAAALQQLGPLDEERIPGGCDKCNSFQMVELSGPGVWMLTVYHNDDCSFLKAQKQ